MRHDSGWKFAAFERYNVYTSANIKKEWKPDEYGSPVELLSNRLG